MKIIETTVYNFDELSDSAKEKARQWFREGDTYDGQDVIEDAASVAAMLGIEIATHEQRGANGKTFQVTCIFFSGFSSQGDGACFEGDWQASRVQADKVKEYAPSDETLHKIAGNFQTIAKAFPHASFSVKHSGHYYHDGCTDFDINIVDADGEPIETGEAYQAGADLMVTARLFMKWIYRNLEADYTWRNSDEVVDETIIANCYTFTVDGKRFGE